MKYFYLTKAFRQVQILKVQNLQNGFSVSFFQQWIFSSLNYLNMHKSLVGRTSLTWNSQTAKPADVHLKSCPHSLQLDWTPRLSAFIE